MELIYEILEVFDDKYIDMDNVGPYLPYGSTGVFSSLLANVQGGSQTSTTQATVIDSEIIDDIEADAFGIDHEDDLHQEEECNDGAEGENVELTREKANEIIMKAAASITPSWNDAHEPITQELDTWTTWDLTTTFTCGMEFQKGLFFNSIEELIYQMQVYSISNKKSFRVLST